MKSVSPLGSDPAWRPPVLLRTARYVSRVHRWLGVVVCLFFALWFSTGAVMMYVPFPSLADADRIEASPAIDLHALRLSPSEAVATAAGASAVERLKLISVLRSPCYLLTLADGRVISVPGTGAAAVVDAATARRVAEAFVAQPILSTEGPFDYDQWVVHQKFDAARPFFRAVVGDVAGTQIYVSARTGEVLQRTTRFERGWNWVGSIVHWLYPTVLRKSFSAWDQTVWWLSLAGLTTALLGMSLGCVRVFNLRRKKNAGVSPFRGWLRLHHVLGLSAGTLVLTWVFSGWLSMDHGRLFSLEIPEGPYEARMRGMTISDAVRGITVKHLAALGDPHEIEFTAVDGRPWLIVRGGHRASSMVVAASDLPDVADPMALLPDALLLSAARKAWAPLGTVGIASIAADDAYGRLRNNPLPKTTRRITLDDAGETWVHIDAASGRLISVMDNSRRLLRWLFDGLHTFDFPFFRSTGPLWKILMWAGLVLGFAFSVTAVVIGVRRLANTCGLHLRRFDGAWRTSHSLLRHRVNDDSSST